MLAELAAANAAFAIIKKCVENGSELAKAGQAISDFTLNKDAVQKKAASKGSNLDGSKSDLEEFLALDELKRKEDALRSIMQLYGRAGMYPDYVKFCAEARRQRAEAVKEAQRKAAKLQDDIILALYWVACLAVGATALNRLPILSKGCFETLQKESVVVTCRCFLLTLHVFSLWFEHTETID